LKNMCGWSDAGYERQRDPESEKYRPPDSMVLDEEQIKKLTNKPPNSNEDS
jgi:hypothetical protein